MNKKIGILTFHSGMNYGGFFQMFSTYEFVRQLGYKVEIINYTHPKHFINEKRYFFLRNIKESFKSLQRHRCFNKGLKKVNLSQKYFYLSQDHIDNYDVIIVGSDIVWNYDWSFLGSIKNYVFHNLNPKNAIAFVPSCGFVDPKKPVPPYFKKGLSKFNAISVRDSLTQRIVLNCTNKLPPILLDPTFLINHNEYVGGKFESASYVLVYSFLNIEKHKQELNEFSKKSNLKIISVGYYLDWADENLSEVDPFEWLGLFKNAKFIYTSTFHGTLFSIHFEKQFVTITNQKIEKKIDNIIKLTNLEDRIKIKSASIKKTFFEPIDYEISRLRVNDLINKTKTFLISNL